jgi:hypothetical protein
LTNGQELVSSLVYLSCGAEQENPPHRENHEDSDKDSHGEGDEDYLHELAPSIKRYQLGSNRLSRSP